MGSRTTQQPATVSSTKCPRLLRRDMLLSDGVTSQQEEYHAAGQN